MADQKRERGNATGPTAATVAENVKRVRTAKGLTQKDLANRLEQIGRPIPPASVGKLEMNLRRVEVDDLVALAIALEVSPLALLLPDTRRPDEVADLTGRLLAARDAWLWAVGAVPYGFEDDGREPNPVIAEFQSLTMPWWLDLIARVPTDSLRENDRRVIIESNISALYPADAPQQGAEIGSPHDRHLESGDIGEPVMWVETEPVDPWDAPVREAVDDAHRHMVQFDEEPLRRPFRPSRSGD